jgi:HAAS
MNPNADLAADLPPPNADEPASLRRDILDELADHLACAARQEALRAELDTDGETPDEQTIADRVLARFGDPRRIARRLWFDAMKGRLMMQKLTAAFAAVAAVGAIAGCVLLWTAMDATRSTLAEAIAENRKERQAAEEADRENRLATEKANRAMLAQIASLEAKSTSERRRLEWKALKLQLVHSSKGNPPAKGLYVWLKGQPYGASEKQEIPMRSDSKGFVDFGEIRLGRYEVTVMTAWNARREFSLNLLSRSPELPTIVCPSEPVVKVPVQFKAEFPPQFKNERFALLVSFIEVGQIAGNKVWRIGYSEKSRFGVLLLRPNKPVIWLFHGLARGPEDLVATASIVRHPKGLPPYIQLPADNEIHLERKLPTLTHRIVALTLLHRRIRSGSKTAEDQSRQYDYLASMLFRVPGGFRGVPSKGHPTFTPQADKENVWKITLPPQLIEQARKTMKRVDELKKKSPGGKA